MGQPALKFQDPETYVSADDYLIYKREAEERRKFANGRVWPMAGAEMAHNDISYSLNPLIGLHLRQ